MTATEIIETLRSKLAVPTGRHLYGVLGTYAALDAFAQVLQEVRAPDGTRFPAPLSANCGILDAIPDEEFRDLAKDEAKMPEPTAKHVARAFESLLRAELKKTNLLVLANLEVVFAYGLELSILRTLAADEDRVLLLLPGRREHEKILMFPEFGGQSHTLPSNLIAENHLWELVG